MRVLHLIDTLGRGGAENLLVTLLPALAPEGIETVVGVLRPPYDLQPALEERGIRVVRLPRFHRWNLPRATRALRKVCREEQIELVHAHLYFPGLYAASLSLRGGPPMIETFHNLAYAGANAGNWKLGLRRLVRAHLLGRAGTRFFGVSQAVAAHYSKALRLPDVGVLCNVIDLAAIDATPVAGRSTDTLQIVVPGRLVPEKGHADLLAALQGAQMPPYSLRFVGGGPLHARLEEEAARAGIAVKILGNTSHAAFLAEVAAADIVVTPSRHEGFGIAAAEAMALGKPLIASRAGGLPEVAGDAGLLFDAGDIAALRTALQHLAEDSDLRRQLGEKGARRARRLFDPKHAAEQLAAAYRATVPGDRAGRHG